MGDDNLDAKQKQLLSLQDDVRRLTQENYALQERIMQVHIETFESFAVLDRVMRENYKLYHDLRIHEFNSLADRDALAKIEELMSKAGVRKAPVVEMVRTLTQNYQHPGSTAKANAKARREPRDRPTPDGKPNKRQRVDHDMQPNAAATWYNRWKTLSQESPTPASHV